MTQTSKPLHDASERNMVEWFHERYIARTEHEQVVDYYKKLVVQLHRKVSELRAHIDTLPSGGFDFDGPQAGRLAFPPVPPSRGTMVAMSSASRLIAGRGCAARIRGGRDGPGRPVVTAQAA